MSEPSSWTDQDLKSVVVYLEEYKSCWPKQTHKHSHTRAHTQERYCILMHMSQYRSGVYISTCIIHIHSDATVLNWLRMIRGRWIWLSGDRPTQRRMPLAMCTWLEWHTRTQTHTKHMQTHKHTQQNTNTNTYTPMQTHVNTHSNTHTTHRQTHDKTHANIHKTLKNKTQILPDVYINKHTQT